VAVCVCVTVCDSVWQGMWQCVYGWYLRAMLKQHSMLLGHHLCIFWDCTTSCLTFRAHAYVCSHVSKQSGKQAVLSQLVDNVVATDAFNSRTRSAQPDTTMTLPERLPSQFKRLMVCSTKDKQTALHLATSNHH
jgi:hypothetical protein